MDKKCSDYDCDELAIGETTVAGECLSFCRKHLYGIYLKNH